jgi:DNA (cytosine-5)-methyltransferase 1
VFVVGYLGNWRPAAAVLFERHSLCGYPAPSREKRESAASTITTRTGVSRNAHEECVIAEGFYEAGFAQYQQANVSGTIKASGGVLGGGSEVFLVQPIALAENTIVNATGVHGVAQPINIYGGNKRTDRPEGGFYVRMDEDISKTLDAASGLNPTCSQGGTAVLQPLPFDTTQITSPQNGNNPKAGDPCHSLAAGAHPPAIAQPIAFSRNDDGRDATHNLAPTMRVAGNAGGMLGIATSMAVRRLTPVECERLQGFPDGYTDIQPKGKATPDGPRYKALGNSMAVPVMAWIGQRIQQVEDILG